MFEIRLHGRGGQGVVTGASLLSLAAFIDGQRAQAFPSFGSERMGAPVVSYCRLDRAAIRLREPVLEPDAVIVQDPTLLHSLDVFAGLKPAGYALINSARTPERLGIASLAARLPAGHVACIPASEIALQHLGRPIPNAALIGGFARLTGLLRIEAVEAAIADFLPAAAVAGNRAAARAAYDRMVPAA